MPSTSRGESTSRMVRQREQLGPRAAERIPVVHIRSKTWHPILYRKRVQAESDASPGDLVAIYVENQASPFGYGLYNPRSEMTVRILWDGIELPDTAAWSEKLSDAVRLRRETLKVQAASSAWRVIHAESDGLSGLVVDCLGDVLSAEIFSLGMYQRAQLLMPMLLELTGAKHWLVRTSPQFLSQEGCDPPELMSENCPSSVVVQENSVRYRVKFSGGHKTGFFCDQRENRLRLTEFTAGKSVLDLCCYTGGFSVMAKVLGEAEEVTGVDLDETPLEVARENANLNQARVRFVQADAFAYMREMIRNGRRYDVVILDPPKLIRSRSEIEEGTRRHYAMNRLAMRLVRPGGLLLSCSCAGLLSEAEFLQLLTAASRSVGDDLVAPESVSAQVRPLSLQIIARTGAAADHPVIASCPETEYLKAVWMVVR